MHAKGREGKGGAPQNAPQGIPEIRGLDACAALERLWLCENHIASLAGLSRLGRLRELHVYSNRWARATVGCAGKINATKVTAVWSSSFPSGSQPRAMVGTCAGGPHPAAAAAGRDACARPARRLTATTGLEALTALEVLSLANNYISRIEGLSGLPRLRELNLASNEVSAAAVPLAGCGALTVLNLAANCVATFQVRPSGGVRGARRCRQPRSAGRCERGSPRQGPSKARDATALCWRQAAAAVAAAPLAGAARARLGAAPAARPVPARPPVGGLPAVRAPQLLHRGARGAAGADGARHAAGVPRGARGGGRDAGQEAGARAGAEDHGRHNAKLKQWAGLAGCRASAGASPPTAWAPLTRLSCCL